MVMDSTPAMPRLPAPARSGTADPARRHCLRLAGLLGAGLWAAAGCGERTPLRVGFIGGLSGRAADLGIGGRNGAQLGVEDLNAADGFAGRRIELLARDDEQNVELARQRLTELFDAGVAFVVGPMTSAMAVALAPLANARGLPLISPTSTTHELSGKPDAFFRVVPDAPTGAHQQADELLARGGRRLATVADLNNHAFSDSWVQAAARRFVTQGGTLVSAIQFRSAPGLSYGALAEQVAASRADVIIIAASASDTALLSQHIRHLEPSVALATSPWAGTEQFPEMGGRALEGMLVAQYFDRDSQARRYLDFVQRYTRRFGEAPGYPAVNGYDALMVGIAGLRQRGDGTLLASLTRSRSHDGLQRRIDLDPNGDSRSPMYLNEVHDGHYVAPAPR
jgi:branched-chain amino acid transport system substrate-binding protein